MANPADPARLRPLLGRRGQRRAGRSIGLQDWQVRPLRVVAQRRPIDLGRWAVEVEDDLAGRVKLFEPADESQGFLDLALGVFRAAEHERELGDHAVLAAACGHLQRVVDAGPFAHRIQDVVAGSLRAGEHHLEARARHLLPRGVAVLHQGVDAAERPPRNAQPRNAVGKFGGALKDFTLPKLGGLFDGGHKPHDVRREAGVSSGDLQVRRS